MRVLVTGGAGFVGSHLVNTLIDLQHEVAVVDDLSTGSRENLRGDTQFFQADVRASLNPIFGAVKPEVVIHLAAQVSVPESVQDPARDASINMGGTINVVQSAAAVSVRKVILLSSAAVYGKAEGHPLQETEPVAPRSPYGLSKWGAEQSVRFLCDLYGMSYTVLRPANIFGPRQVTKGEGAVIPSFLNEFLRVDGCPVIHGPGTQVRDFIYVSDAADAIARTISRADGLTLNVSSGKGITISELWATLAELVAWRRPPVFGPSRSGDIYYSVLSNGAAREQLGWSPSTSLREGLLKTLLWAQHSFVARGRAVLRI